MRANARIIFQQFFVSSLSLCKNDTYSVLFVPIKSQPMHPLPATPAEIAAQVGNDIHRRLRSLRPPYTYPQKISKYCRTYDRFNIVVCNGQYWDMDPVTILVQ